MLPDRVSIPGPLTYESGALPTALCGPAMGKWDGLVGGTRRVIYLSLKNFLVLMCFHTI